MYEVSVKNPLGILGVYGTRVVAGTHETVEAANEQASYISSFHDSAVAIAQTEAKA